MLDPLSSVLSLLNPRSALTTRLELGGPWSLRFPAYDGIKFNVLQRGQCWLKTEDSPEPMQLQAGDGYLLSAGRPYVLTSSPDLAPRDARGIVALAQNGIVNHGGDEVILLRGKFTFDSQHAPLLLDTLPPVIRLPRAHASVVQWTLQELWGEVRNPGPGTALVVDHLSHLMLIHGLRAFLEDTAHGTANWLTALSHPQIGSALSLMHARPAEAWTLEKLAAHAGLSRSRFAQQFRSMVGVPPLTYLVQWRMRMAMRWLRRSQRSITQIAESLGYESDSAFSHAFRREMGLSPLRYRKAPRLQLQTAVPTERPPSVSAATPKE